MGRNAIVSLTLQCPHLDLRANRHSSPVCRHSETDKNDVTEAKKRVLDARSLPCKETLRGREGVACHSQLAGMRA